MSYSTRIFINRLIVGFVFLMSIINCNCEKISCFSEPGDSVGSETCKGDYCIYVKTPGESASRGCLNGDLLSDKIADRCEHSTISKQDLCLCSKKSGCNSDTKSMLRGGTKHKTKILRCYSCDTTKPGNNCTISTSNTKQQNENLYCYGEYCTITKYPDGRLVRACSEPGLPLFERKGFGTCLTPSIPSYAEEKNYDDQAMRAVTCACNNKDLCNGPVLPDRIPSAGSKAAAAGGNSKSSSLKKCKVRAYARFKFGTFETLNIPPCTGEHCFQVWAEMDGVSVNITGCMSYFDTSKSKGSAPKHHPSHPDFNDRGCMEMESKTLRFKACLDKNIPTAKGENEKGNDDEEEGEEKPVPPTSPPDGDKNRIQAPEKIDVQAAAKEFVEGINKENESTGGKMAKLVHKISHQVAHQAIVNDGEDPDDPRFKKKHENSDGNTAIVAVFVAIMIAIVIAGVVWKFELHKKIFHARYQSVAG